MSESNPLRERHGIGKKYDLKSSLKCNYEVTG